MNINVKKLCVAIAALVIVGIIGTSSATAESGNWYKGDGGIALTVGQTSTINLNSQKLVSTANIAVGCKDGETMDGYVEYLSNSGWINVQQFTGAGCNSNINFPETITNSLRLTMTNGGGADNKISWYSDGSNGWKVYAIDEYTPVPNTDTPSSAGGSSGGSSSGGSSTGTRDWCVKGSRTTSTSESGQLNLFEIMGITNYDGKEVCWVEMTNSDGSNSQYFNKDNSYFIMVVKDKYGNVINNMDLSTPISQSPTPTPELFKVGPTVRIRPLNDEISNSQNGLVELYLDNPGINTVMLTVDIRISTPQNVRAYGEGFTKTTDGAMYRHLEILPGTAKTINLEFESEINGNYNVQFTGTYYPGNNNGAYQPISLIHPFKVYKQAPTPTPDIEKAMKSPVHTTHVGPNSAGLECDTCHGSPPKIPPSMQVCDNCHPVRPTPTPFNQIVTPAPTPFEQIVTPTIAPIEQKVTPGPTSGNTLTKPLPTSVPPCEDDLSLYGVGRCYGYWGARIVKGLFSGLWTGLTN